MAETGAVILEELYRVIESRKGADPAESYTAALLAGGAEKAGQKLGEEAVETVIAALEASRLRADAAPDDPEPTQNLVEEVSDLLYHLLVLLLDCGVEPGRVAERLTQRHTRGGTP